MTVTPLASTCVSAHTSPYADVDDELVTSPEACKRAGVTFRQLDHWVAGKLVLPTVKAPGSGYWRGWSDLDICRLRVIGQLSTHGWGSERQARNLHFVAQEIADMDLRSGWLLVSGRQVSWAESLNRLRFTWSGLRAFTVIKLAGDAT